MKKYVLTKPNVYLLLSESENFKNNRPTGWFHTVFQFCWEHKSSHHSQATHGHFLWGLQGAVLAVLEFKKRLEAVTPSRYRAERARLFFLVCDSTQDKRSTIFLRRYFDRPRPGVIVYKVSFIGVLEASRTSSAAADSLISYYLFLSE